MLLVIVTLALAAFADGKNVTNACPKVAVQAAYGGNLLWQLLVQGYYILNNISGDVWSLLECRDEGLLDSAECFLSALETLKETVGSYRPFILDYKQKVYNYGVGIVEDWECCIGSEFCEEQKRPKPKLIDLERFKALKETFETVNPPTPLPTVPPSPPTQSPTTKQQLGSISIRARLFGVDFLIMDIDLTNLFV